MACAETTPTMRVAAPVCARAAMQAQMPEPWPTGTNTTAGCTARKNSIQ